MTTTAPAAPPLPDRTRTTRARRRQAVQGWLFASPTAIFVLLLFVIPLLLVLQMSGSDWPLLGGNRGWNLPENYVDAVNNRFFWDSVWFTIQYTVIATVLLIGLGLGLALLVQESTRWKSLIRTAFLVPSALGLASASLLFYVLYSPIAGPFADLMKQWGFTFLGTPQGALWSTVFLIVWRYAGFYMLLMLVGLQGIPEDVYEAARIDGASPWTIFWSITVPLLMPTIFFVTTISIIASFQVFNLIYVMTGGGPGNSTKVYVFYLWENGFSFFKMGYASALAYVLFVIILAITLIQARFLGRTPGLGGR